jgi:murein L,D-transpeptidase YcbB/YkuD
MLPKSSFGSICLAYLFLLHSSGVASAEGGLRERLQQLRSQNNPSVAGAPMASARLLDDFYRARDHRYVWQDSRQVQDLLRLAKASVDEGLQPSDFHVQEISDTAGVLPPSALPASERVDLDILMSDALLRLIHHRHYGKVAPQRLDKNWGGREGPFADDLLADLKRAISAPDLQAELERIAAQPPFYRRLKKALAHYRGIVAAGGWPTVPAGKLLKPGMTDPRVPVVRKRLRVTGDYQGPASDGRKYDADLKAAVLAFQARHHLGTDAVVGPATRAAMNISADARVDQIRVNLERMRWAADRLPADLLLVDIAGQEVRLFRDEKLVWTSRVVVGRPERPTPVLRDQVEYLEVNPRWTVPPTILKKDILPAMRKNPGYLKKKGLQVVTRDGKRVSPGSVNWNTSAASFPYMIRQPPGERNALGRVKFMFPNRFSVYLHDTPTRSLFDKPKRLYSSGCVRVDKPWELAELVLNDPMRWSQEKLKDLVASKRTRWIRLKEPLSVILAYWTAEAAEGGRVMFREDVYDRDAAVLSALDGNGPVRILFPVPPKTQSAALSAPPAQKQAAEAPATEPEIRSKDPRQGALAAQ